jgi:hypothetical protein
MEISLHSQLEAVQILFQDLRFFIIRNDPNVECSAFRRLSNRPGPQLQRYEPIVCVLGEQRESTSLELQQVNGSRIDSICLDPAPPRDNCDAGRCRAYQSSKSFVQELFKAIGLAKTGLRLVHIPCINCANRCDRQPKLLKSSFA